MIDELSQRIERASQSLLENEALTADLDDDSADILLQWGLDSVKAIAQKTAELDDSQAEEAMYPLLKANRKMMKAISRLLTAESGSDPAQRAEQLGQILEQAQAIYGVSFEMPSHEQLENLVRSEPALQGEPAQLIAALRQYVEQIMAS